MVGGLGLACLDLVGATRPYGLGNGPGQSTMRKKKRRELGASWSCAWMVLYCDDNLEEGTRQDALLPARGPTLIPSTAGAMARAWA